MAPVTEPERAPHDVVVVGSVNLDLVARVRQLPVPGETVTASSFLRVPGGKGANQALAARRAGARVRLVAAVGDDAGPALELLRRDGVDLGGVREVRGPTGLALIGVDALGETTVVVIPGANDELRVDPADLAGAAAVLTVLEVPDVAVRATAQGAPGLFVLNAAPARPVAPEVLERADLVVVNRLEHAALDGLPGARAVVVTSGASGAVLLRDGREVARAAPPPVDAVDSTAAGDAFVGAAVVGLLDGLDDEQLLARACAAGALAVTRSGAQPSLPTAAEVDGVLAR